MRTIATSAAAAACCLLTATASASIPQPFGVTNHVTFGALASRGGSVGEWRFALFVIFCLVWYIWHCYIAMYESSGTRVSLGSSSCTLGNAAIL